jgi:hypothetical protein
VEPHDRRGPVLQIGKPLHVGLALALIAFLKLSGELLLDGFRTRPGLQPLPVDLVPDLNIGQCGERCLKLIQEVVGLAGRLCQRCKMLLRGRATRHRVTLPFWTAFMLTLSRSRNSLMSRGRTARGCFQEGCSSCDLLTMAPKVYGRVKEADAAMPNLLSHMLVSFTKLLDGSSRRTCSTGQTMPPQVGGMWRAAATRLAFCA